MAVKYHLKDDGLPGECTARPGRCPLKGEHYSSKIEALEASEEKLRSENNYLSSLKRSKVYHVSKNGGIEDCKFREGYCEVKPFGNMGNVHSSDKSVINGAAIGMRAAQGGIESETNSNTIPKTIPKVSNDKVTNTARKILNGEISSWNTEKLKKGWTEEEIIEYQNSCGHSGTPKRLRPKNNYNYC